MSSTVKGCFQAPKSFLKHFSARLILETQTEKQTLKGAFKIFDVGRQRQTNAESQTHISKTLHNYQTSLRLIRALVIGGVLGLPLFLEKAENIASRKATMTDILPSFEN